jgi:hypothetical protein
MKADKGNSTAILDKDDYHNKLTTLLADTSTHKVLKRNPTGGTERKLNQFIFKLYQEEKIKQQQYYNLRSTDGTIPRLYGLPKIHKETVPLRPIVSFIGSPTYNLAKFIS